MDGTARCPPKDSAERVDGPGTAHASTGGYATGDKGDRVMRRWPTVIDFSDVGCWAVTEALGPTTVRFVIGVPADRSVPADRAVAPRRPWADQGWSG